MSENIPTGEQQSAFRRMDDYVKSTWGSQMLEDWEDLVAALPDALTNPQPALPTEPGMYVSHTDKHGAWLLHGDGDWWPPFQDYSVPLSEVQAAAPFRRLVVEDDTPRHVFTGEELQEIYFRHTGPGSGATWRAVANYVNTKEA